MLETSVRYCKDDGDTCNGISCHGDTGYLDEYRKGTFFAVLSPLAKTSVALIVNPDVSLL